MRCHFELPSIGGECSGLQLRKQVRQHLEETFKCHVKEFTITRKLVQRCLDVQRMAGWQRWALAAKRGRG